MSSTLISAKVFCAAYTPFLKKLKLAGDWLFIGQVMQHGDVVFSSLTLNNFRRHEQTARVRVKQAAEWAEYIITIYILFKEANRPVREFAPLMALPARHFMRSVPLQQLVKALIAISWLDTLRCTLLLAISMFINFRYFKLLFVKYRGN